MKYILFYTPNPKILVIYLVESSILNKFDSRECFENGNGADCDIHDKDFTWGTQHMQ